MRGRIWLLIGVVVGLAVALGRLPYLAGAGRSLADTTLRLVDSGANHLVRDLAAHGAPRRVVEGLGGLIAVLLPGTTALLLIVAARGTLRLRSIIAVLIMVVGAASFAYEPHGKAAGVLFLCLAIAGLAVALTGPLLVAPLAGVAALIGAEYLPSLILARRHISQANVQAVHLAIFDKPGAPVYLQLLLLIAAALPFALAARLVIRS